MDEIMEKKYVCNLCGQPITLKEPTNHINGWCHESIDMYDKCHAAWRLTHDGSDDIMAYWKSYYGVELIDTSQKFLLKRDIIIWQT